MALIQFPDGEWYEPSYVTAVEAADRYVGLEYIIEPRVILHLRSGPNGDRRTINCESLEAAQKMRDEIAALVNRAADAPQIIE